MVNTQDIAGTLKAHGVMPTQQRLMIARVLFESRQHLSAEQVLGRVNDSRDRVSKATVYNTLGLFARNGLVREVIVDPTRVFYDSNTKAHQHFYNVDTGMLQDVDVEHLSLHSMPVPPSGTELEGVDIIVRVRSSS